MPEPQPTPSGDSITTPMLASVAGAECPSIVACSQWSARAKTSGGPPAPPPTVAGGRAREDGRPPARTVANRGVALGQAGGHRRVVAVHEGLVLDAVRRRDE